MVKHLKNVIIFSTHFFPSSTDWRDECVRERWRERDDNHFVMHFEFLPFTNYFNFIRKRYDKRKQKSLLFSHALHFTFFFLPFLLFIFPSVAFGCVIVVVVCAVDALHSLLLNIINNNFFYRVFNIKWRQQTQSIYMMLKRWTFSRILSCPFTLVDLVA